MMFKHIYSCICEDSLTLSVCSFDITADSVNRLIPVTILNIFGTAGHGTVRSCWSVQDRTEGTVYKEIIMWTPQ